MEVGKLVRNVRAERLPGIGFRGVMDMHAGSSSKGHS